MRTGCLIVVIPLVLILLLVGWVAIVQTHLLEKAGLRQSPEDRLLGGAPDFEAAQALKAELLSAGFSDAGLGVAVLPGKTGVITWLWSWWMRRWGFRAAEAEN